MNGNRIRLFVFGTVVLSLLVMGCGDRGPKLVKATGKVTYQGEPLPKATVVFVPEGEERTAFATTDEQGDFVIATNGRPGAIPGTYKVAVTAIRLLREVSEEEAISMSNEQIYANQESLIPVKYNNGISSGMVATVSSDASDNHFAFELQ
jgi:hypothetical protein